MEIKVSPQARAEIDDLDIVIHDRVLNVLDRLEKWPQVSGTKGLTGPWKGHMRIRTGDYRVVFRVLKSQGIIVVERVAHRSEVYD